MFKTVGGLSFMLGLIAFVLKFLRRRNKNPVKDKVVLISGASSGLGEACAHVFYDDGAKVILCARREKELQRVKTDLLAKPNSNAHEPIVLPLDLSQLKSIPQKVCELLESCGHIDILVNNGGISYRGQVCDTSVEVDQRLMLVNYLGTVALTKAVLPSMLARRTGHVVAISSMQGRISIPFRAAYSASKHALQAFCDCLRAELSQSNIHVTVLSPGYIRTNLSINAVTHDGQQYGVMDTTTASGMLPEDVAKQVLHCVQHGTNELVLAPVHHRLAIYIRTLYPQLFFWLMRKRAKKQRAEMNKTD